MPVDPNDPNKKKVGDDNGGKGNPPEPPKEKTYTEDDMKAIRKQLADEQANHQKEVESYKGKINDFDKQKEALIQKGVKRGQMSAQQLAEDKLNDQKADLEQRTKDLDNKINAFNERNALAETKSSLADKKLPVGFAKYLTDLDEDKRKQNIEEFEKSYRDELDKSVQKGVEERIKGKTTPKNSPSSTVNTNDLTQEKWDKLTLSEQTQIYQDDPELAKKFMR